MKKILALIMSLSVLAFAGCTKADDSATQESVDMTDASVSEETIVEATEQTEAETEPTAEKSAAKNTEETVSETSADTTVETAAVSGEASSLTAAVIEKASEWTAGNIIVSLSYDEEGMATLMEVNAFENNALVHIDIVGLFSTKSIITDGKTYMINDDSRSYSVADTTEEDEQEAVSYQDYLVDEEVAVVPVETGKETIDGKEYTFESFDNEGQVITYYFDDNGDMRYCSTEVDGNKEIVNFTISCLDEPDMSVFEIPADYTEVSTEEMAMLMFGDMFGSEEFTEENEDTEE